jgi:DNA-binding transcriptional LysR family regulator
MRGWKMNLRHLRAFRAVMICGSVTEAAERLRLTQSAVSRHLSTLESEIGFDLFARHGGRLVPTPEGHAFFEQAERVLIGVDEIAAIARDIRTYRSARLRLAAIPLLAHGLLPRALAAFIKRNPTVRASFVMPPQWDFGYWMAGQQFDLGLTILPLEHPSLRSEVFADVAGVVALPPNHPLASLQELGVADIADEPLIAQPQHALLRERIMAEFAAVGAVPNVQAETVSGFTACQLVAQGLGIAIVDAFSAYAIEPGRIEIRPWTASLRISCAFIFPADRPPSQLVHNFRDSVHATVRDLARAAPAAFHHIP